MDKLTDTDLEALRRAFARGGSAVELAVEFGASERHVRRLVADVEGEHELTTSASSVEGAVVAFLDAVSIVGSRTGLMIFGGAVRRGC